MGTAEQYLANLEGATYEQEVELASGQAVVLTFGAVQPDPRPTNTYLVELEFMYGDADGEETVEFLFQQGLEVAEFVAYIDWLSTVEPHGRLGSDHDYSGETTEKLMSDPRFIKYFFNFTKEEFLIEQAEGIHKPEETFESVMADGWGECSWPYEGDAQIYTALRDLKIFWCTDKGLRRPVSYTVKSSFSLA